MTVEVTRGSGAGVISIHPLSPDRWGDLEALFGPRGACGGCWCMWFRLPRREYEDGKGAVNRAAMQALVADGNPTGILAYDDRGRPIGWCSVAPRSQYLRLGTSRVMTSAGPEPLWSILCLFIEPSRRREGHASTLIREASNWAASLGAAAVEGFPIIPRTPDVPPAFASQGTLSAFLAAGFREISRPSDTRAVVLWP